jgi:hypothetical protein
LAKIESAVAVQTKGFAGLVVVGDEVIDLGHQVGHRAERAAPDRLGADVGEEALDQVEPRAVGGDEVELPAGRAASQA